MEREKKKKGSLGSVASNLLFPTLVLLEVTFHQYKLGTNVCMEKKDADFRRLGTPAWLSYAC